MKVLVCGGRDFDQAATVFAELDALHKECPIECIITGDADGADASARLWAKSRGVELREFRARWKEYGRAAGPKRNAEMIEAAPHMILAFPGGAGTRDMCLKALRANVPVKVAK